MSTTLLPDTPPAATPPRLASIRANLLPDELIAARRLAELKRRIGIGLLALLAVIIVGYGWSWLQTSSAHSALSSANHTTTTLQKQRDAFAPLVTAQTESAAVSSALKQLMVGDLSWSGMLDTLSKSAAPSGITLTEVNGTLYSGAASASAAGAPGFTVLNQSGQQPVGSMTIDGSAPDKNAVASYVDSLAKVPGLAAPFPASITAVPGGHELGFSVNVIITSGALGGRYATASGGH